MPATPAQAKQIDRNRDFIDGNGGDGAKTLLAVLDEKMTNLEKNLHIRMKRMEWISGSVLVVLIANIVLMLLFGK